MKKNVSVVNVSLDSRENEPLWGDLVKPLADTGNSSTMSSLEWCPELVEANSQAPYLRDQAVRPTYIPLRR
jgi:hypothetical protein